MKFFYLAYKTFIDALLPQRCIVCDELSESGSYFCKECHGKIEPITYKVCIGCGMNEKECECGRFIYHFDGVVAPFINDGCAKEAFYNFKFYKNFSSVDYFSENMARAFNENLSKLKFDFICYIPLSSKGFKRKGYDQCEILASKLSKLLNLPLKNIIVRQNDAKTQHYLTLDERFENVKDEYRVTASVKNKRVLLIDDIKTTGATLDACARELKFAGAKSVHCLTALIGNKD